MSRTTIAALIFALLLPVAVNAQLNGHNSRGDFGLQSGTQAPPGFYVVPLLYDYRADTLRDRSGDRRPARPGGGEIEVQAGIVGLLWTSETKVFGGTYGVEIWPGVTNNALEAPFLGVDSSTSNGLADLYVRPVSLGWNTDRADFIAGLGFYAPTGDWELGGDSNRGLGMWGYEIFGGTTVYFDEAHTWHLSALASYEMHDKKEDTNIRVGDVLTIEGGLGKSFMDGALAVGVAYYAQWKVTKDDLGLSFSTPNAPLSNKHRVYGFGPEVMLPIASKSTLFGFLTLRYLWETGARSTLEGNTFVALLSFPVPSIPLQ
ncbi:MAG: SphA family protein [Gammaproteobacteria bacterium]